MKAIEFDKKDFPTVADCTTWLKGTTYSYLLDLKGFTLRSRKQSIFLTWEKRPVFYYYSPTLWQEVGLTIKRPNRGVCEILGNSQTASFTENDIPQLQEETEKKIKEKAARKEELKKKNEERKEARKQKTKRDSSDKPKKRKKTDHSENPLLAESVPSLPPFPSEATQKELLDI